jgi:hypothetical protein
MTLVGVNPPLPGLAANAKIAPKQTATTGPTIGWVGWRAGVPDLAAGDTHRLKAVIYRPKTRHPTLRLFQRYR